MQITLKKYLVILVFLLLSNLQSRSQVTLTYDPVSCGVPTTNVMAAVSCGPNIPYNAGIVVDDIYSGAVPIGFTFNFYGISYDTVVIGANGIISFQNTLAGSYNPWSITGSLTSSTIRNSICAPWCDMGLPDDGNAHTYQRSGTAPNRKFIVNYCHLPMYSLAYCPSQWVTSQVILYENSNVIEVHIGHKTICTSWNNGRAICGVINAAGSSSTIAPSRDWSTNWSATHEAWRFTPLGSTGYSVAPVSYAPAFCDIAVYWYDSVSRAYLGAGSNINISTSVTRHIKAAVFSNCEDTSFYYITVPVPVILPVPKQILGPYNLCEGDSVVYTDSTLGGTWAFSPNLSANIHANHIDIKGLHWGDAFIKYTLPAGCFVTRLVTVNPLPSHIYPNPISFCRGDTVNCIDSITNGKWASGNLAIARIDSVLGTLAGIAPGTAIISYTTPKGCRTAATATVNPIPSGISPADTVLCQESTIAFNNLVPGGLWSSSNPSIAAVNPSLGLATGIAPGVATISYTLSGGCFKTANITVKVTPGSIAPAPASICMGATLVFSDADFGGSWSSSNPAIASVGLGSGITTPVSPGTALITYSFTNGCYRTASLSVNPLPPVIVPSEMSVCVGNTATFSPISAGGLWSVDDTSIAHIAATTGTVTGISAGVTTVSYTLATGCARTRTVTINAPPGPITPAPGIVCVGDQLFLSDTTGGGTWSSTNTAIGTVTTNSGIVTGIAPGTTIVSYTLPGGCYATDIVIVSALPTAITPASMDICQGGTVTFTASPPGGIWSSDNPAIALTGTSGSVTGVASGTATISYTLATGCYRTAQIHIAPASPIVPSEAVICTGKSVTFTNTGTGGTWSVASAAIASIGTGTFTVSATGIAPGTTTLTYSFPGGCYRTAFITVNSTPANINGMLKTCALDTTRLADTAGGGTGLWSSSTPTYGTVSPNGIVTGISGGTTTISYTVANGCSATAIVTVFALPDAGTITGSDLICRGNAVEQLKDIPGNPGLWYSDDPVVLAIDSVTGIVSGVTGGAAIITYQTASDSNGCANFTTFNVHVISSPPFTITGNITAPKCFGGNDGSILVNISNGSGAYAYQWQDSSSTAFLAPLTSGDYSVTVTDTKTHCANSKRFTVSQPDSLDMTTEVRPDVCNQGIGNIKVNVTGGTSPYVYGWANGSTGTEITSLVAGNYYLALIDSAGCHKFFNIPVRDSSGHVHIHNAVSPNGDGYNDVWVIDFIEDNPYNQVQVFNQWGNMIWQRNSYSNDWDGTGMNGEKLPDGTYYYVIKLNNTEPKCGNNLYKGALLIKR